MIQSYTKFYLKDRNGMDLSLLPIIDLDRRVDTILNENFLDDIDGL